MTRPYFTDSTGRVEIYLGDMRELFPVLALDAHVLVSDPPYGMNWAGNVSGVIDTCEPVAGDHSTELRDTMIAMWGSKPALVFGTWKAARPVGFRHLLVWDKGNIPGVGHTSMPWGHSHEEVYVYGQGFAGKRVGNVLRFNMLAPGDNERPRHPTPKPIPLMEHLIDYCPPGTVIDPFAGTSTTLIAAKRLGRRAIGIELEERYCEISAKRLQQEVFAFGAPPAIAEQDDLPFAPRG